MNRLLQIYLIFWFLSLSSYLLGYYALGYFIPFFWVPLGSFSILSVLILYNLRKKISLFLSMKLTQKGLKTGLWLLIFSLILLALNIWVTRHDTVYDFSANKANSLSVSTIGVLQRLEHPAHIRFFYQSGDKNALNEKQKFVKLIYKYRTLTKKILFDFVDIAEKPDLAKKYGVTQGAGIVFIDYDKQRSRIDRVTEQDITNALDVVSRGDEKVIYFLNGHGEKDTKDPSSLDGANAFLNLLKGNGYTVDFLNLITKTQIPEKVKTIFVLNPQQSFLKHEIEALVKYIKRGGNLLLSLDYGNASSLKPLLDFLEISYNNNYVIGMAETAQGWALTPKLTLAQHFNPQHPITKEFTQGQYAIFRLPSSISIASSKNTPTDIQALLKTGEEVRSFVDLDFTGEQKPGPFTLALSIKKDNSKTVVVASSSFLNNQLWSQGINREFSLNITTYLTDSAQGLKIKPNSWLLGKFTLTPKGLTLYMLLFAIPLPIILLTLSIFRYIRQRAR